MKHLFLLLAILFISVLAHAQQGNTLTIRYVGVPTGTCGPFFLAVNNATSDEYNCTAGGTWNKISGSGGTCAEGTCVVNAPVGNQTILGNHELNIPGLVGAGTSVDGYLNVGPAITALSAYAQTVALPANEFSLNVTTNEPDLTHNFAAAQFMLDAATTFSNVINVFAAVKLAANDTTGVTLEGNFTEVNLNLNGHTTTSGITGTQSNAQLNGTGTMGGNNIAIQAIPVFQSGTQSATSSWGVDSFAFNLPQAVTVTLSGEAAAYHATTPPLNANTLTVPINAQFLAEPNSGTTPTLNALFYGKDNGSNAIDWGLYLAGASKSHVGSGGIQFPGSSSGTATIVAPAAAGTPTLTLPASTGTFALTSQLGTTWDAITAPAGNLSLTMAGNTSTFNTTTANATFFNWKNTTAAVVGTSQGSPLLNLCGRAFHGSADVEDCLTLKELPGNGNDAAITYTIGHTGTSTGVVTTNFPGPISLNGATSGAATITPPAVAGTSTNAMSFSNVVVGPGGNFATQPTYGFTGNLTTGMGNSGDSIYWMLAGTASAGLTSTYFGINANKALAWSSNNIANNAPDTGLSRGAAGVVVCGNGTVSDTTCKLKAAGYMSVGTTFTTNAGCTDTTLVGGATSGKFTIGQSTGCTTIVTMGNSATAPNGWSCWINDQTALATLSFRESASTTTTASFTGTGTSGDVLNFGCMGY